MTYHIVMDANGRPVVVKVEASSKDVALETAKWVVEHAQHLQAHAGGVKARQTR